VTKAKHPAPSFFDEIVAEVGEGGPPEKCRHGFYLHCETCLGETHALASAIGRHDGAGAAVLSLKAAVGKLFADGKDNEAWCLREHTRAIEEQAKRYAEAADELREQRGILKRRKS
jgi:hypothetical protein